MTPASSERAGCACPWACGSQFSAKPPAPSMIVSNGWLDFGSGCKLVLSACLAGSRGAEVIVIMQNQHYVAVDVSKAMLEVALPSAWRTPNTPAGLAALTRKLGGIERPHAVCEATGRYGRLLAREMDAAGIAFSSVNPRQSLPPRRRGCAILPAPPGGSPRPIPLTRVPSLGSLAPCTPQAMPQAPENQARLAERVRRRRQLVDMLATEKQRLSGLDEADTLASIKAHLAFLEGQIATVDDRIAAEIASDARLARRAELLCSIPGPSAGWQASRSGQALAPSPPPC